MSKHWRITLLVAAITVLLHLFVFIIYKDGFDVYRDLSSVYRKQYALRDWRDHLGGLDAMIFLINLILLEFSVSYCIYFGWPLWKKWKTSKNARA